MWDKLLRIIELFRNSKPRPRKCLVCGSSNFKPVPNDPEVYACECGFYLRVDT